MATSAPESLALKPVKLKSLPTKRRLIKAMLGRIPAHLTDAAIDAMPVDQWFDVDLPALEAAVGEAKLKSFEVKRRLIHAMLDHIPEHLTKSVIHDMPIEKWFKVDLTALKVAVWEAIETETDREEAAAKEKVLAKERATIAAVEKLIAGAFNTRHAKVVRLEHKIDGELQDEEDWECRRFHGTTDELNDQCDHRVDISIKVEFSIERAPRPPVATSTKTPSAPVMMIWIRGNIEHDLDIQFGQVYIGSLRSELWVDHNVSTVYRRYDPRDYKFHHALDVLVRKIAVELGVQEFAMEPRNTTINWRHPERDGSSDGSDGSSSE